jgi:C1A family cysteine protease
MDSAFKYVETTDLECESDYPYTAKGSRCAASSRKEKVGVKSYVDVKVNSPSALMAACAQQPVSIAIEADKRAFQSYKSGVLSATSGCGTQLDHGVLLVGYGTDRATGKDYWKVKNSWGSSWGESGYIRLERTSKNDAGTCGLQ